MVAIKLAAVLFVIMVGAFFVNPDELEAVRSLRLDGAQLLRTPRRRARRARRRAPVGMLAGAAIIFFAYIGFDSVSTHAEEAKNPQRDVPIGIVASLLVCTVLYVGVVAVLTGMVPYEQIDDEGRRRRPRSSRVGPRLGGGRSSRSPASPASPRCCSS